MLGNDFHTSVPRNEAVFNGFDLQGQGTFHPLKELPKDILLRLIELLPQSLTQSLTERFF